MPANHSITNVISWSAELKWKETAFSRLCLASARCSLIRSATVLSVSPTCIHNLIALLTLYSVHQVCCFAIDLLLNLFYFGNHVEISHTMTDFINISPLIVKNCIIEFCIRVHGAGGGIQWFTENEARLHPLHRSSFWKIGFRGQSQEKERSTYMCWYQAFWNAFLISVLSYYFVLLRKTGEGSVHETRYIMVNSSYYKSLFISATCCNYFYY